MLALILLALLSSAFAASLIRVDGEDAVPGKWIVKLKGDLTLQAEDELRASISIRPDWTYAMPGFKGFAGSISEQELVQLQASEQVRCTSESMGAY